MKTQTRKYKLSEGFKKKWVDALRSGRYLPACTDSEHCFFFEDFHYSPIGVAYKIAGVPLEQLALITMGEERQFPFVPKELCDHQYGIVQKINKLHNNGNSFKWIASYIEKYL